MDQWGKRRKISNPRRGYRRNLPLTVYVGRKRHTRSALIMKFGALKGSRYWRRAKTKYHGYGKFGARCRTRRKRLKNPRPWQATRRGRRYGLVYGMGSVPVREQKRLLRSYHGLKSVLAPEAMRYGSPRFRKSRNAR